MILDGAFRRWATREAALVVSLVVAAFVVLALVLHAGTAARQAQDAEQAHADLLRADRALVELRLANVEAPPDAPRARAALEAARRDLAQDRDALGLLDRLVPWGSPPAPTDEAALAAWLSLRARLAQASVDADGLARRESERARGVTLAASVLLVSLSLATALVIVAEIRRRKRLAQSLEREANRDPLTMLPNRRFFLEWLAYATAQARRDDTRIALLYIDLDGFKAVNDRHGHRRGDAVLAALAERLRGAKREGDLLARLGGDEFALAVPHAGDGRDLLALGERLLTSLVDPTQPKLADVPVGASIGVAICPDDADDVPGLIAAADAAMYAAKRAGGQRVEFHGEAPA